MCFGLSTSFVCAANPSTADETKIIALENAWNQAQVHHDSRALDSLVSDTFTYTDTDGTVMNKTQFLADNKDPNYNASLVTNEGQKVFSYNSTAVVIGTYHTKGPKRESVRPLWTFYRYLDFDGRDLAVCRQPYDDVEQIS